MQQSQAELDSTMARVEHLLARKDSHVRIEDNQIVLSPLEADPRPASAGAPAQHITERLPRVALSELLMEVDTWTRFSHHFCHAADRRSPSLRVWRRSMPVSWRRRVILGWRKWRA